MALGGARELGLVMVDGGRVIAGGKLVVTLVIIVAIGWSPPALCVRVSRVAGLREGY